MERVWPISRKPRLTPKEIAESVERPPGMPRPSEMTRGDCCYPDAPRPCPLVSCKYNNFLSVTEFGTILLAWPDRNPEDVPPQDSCALDVAERGQSPDDPMSFTELAPIGGFSSKQAVENFMSKAQEEARRIWEMD